MLAPRHLLFVALASPLGLACARPPEHAPSTATASTSPAPTALVPDAGAPPVASDDAPHEAGEDAPPTPAQEPEHGYVLDRAALLARLEPRPACGRLVPTYADGFFQGMRLQAGADSPEIRALGLRKGDLLKSVNGHELDTIWKTLLISEALMHEPRVRLEVERDGRRVVLDYTLR